MTPDRLDEVAGRLVAAHRHEPHFRWQAAPEALELADAYGLQDRVQRVLDSGARPTAWKVSPPRSGAAAVAAPVPGVRCFASPARLAASEFSMLGVEVEIAFRFGHDLPPRIDRYRDEDVFDAVEAMLVALELCDTRLASWHEAPPMWKLADFQTSGALVVGTAIADWRHLDFSALLAQLVVNGGVSVEARGSHPSIDPSVLLPWMVGHVAERCGGLRRGDVVTTGTWTGMQFVAPGDSVEARFPGLGESRLALTA